MTTRGLLRNYLICLALAILPALFMVTGGGKPAWVNGESLIRVLHYPSLWGYLAMAFLGLRLRLPVIALVALTYGLCSHGILLSIDQPDLISTLSFNRLQAGTARNLIAFLLPLSLLLVFAERRPKDQFRRSLVRLTLRTGLAGLFLWAVISPAGTAFLLRLVTMPLLPGVDMPAGLHQPPVLLTLVVVAHTLYRLEIRLADFQLAALVAMLPFFTALAAPGYGRPTVDAVAAGAVSCGILLHSIFRMYWQRVYIDELTSIPNRRALDEALATLDGHYAIAMVDIDHFKKFNDTYGHAEGDNVLRLVADVIGRETRARAFRFGGEEFCLLFRRRDAWEASAIADELRERIAQRDFYLRSAPQKKRHLLSFSPKKTVPAANRRAVKVTISIGVASPETEGTLIDDVFKAADRALYQAKDKGRNRVEIAAYVYDLSHADSIKATSGM